MKDRADAAEEELQRIGSAIPIFSTSVDKRSLSVISTLSDISMGSDEVFVGSPGDKDKSQVIQKDWEVYEKNRDGCVGMDLLCFNIRNVHENEVD